MLLAEEDNENKSFFIITNTDAHSHDDIDQLLSQAIGRGYEGLMIRFYAGPNPTKRQLERSWYKGRRNTNLLKYKNFTDEEGVIIDVIEGKDRNAGVATFVLRDPRGNEFKCDPHGSLDLRKEFFWSRERLIGQVYTYKYFELTAYDVPRFPKGIRFRDYEDQRVMKPGEGLMTKSAGKA